MLAEIGRRSLGLAAGTNPLSFKEDKRNEVNEEGLEGPLYSVIYRNNLLVHLSSLNSRYEELIVARQRENKLF
jgi:hypothetical protein